MKWEVSYVVDQFHGGDMDSWEIIEGDSLIEVTNNFIKEFEGDGREGRLVHFEIYLERGDN
jgi:hypothetical protein